MGGDFNANNNPLDRDLEIGKKYQKDIPFSKFLAENNLHDIWRSYNKESRRYTYERGTDVRSKIDHWLTTKPFFTRFEAKIHKVDKSLSDGHAMIEIEFYLINEFRKEETPEKKPIKYEKDPIKIEKLFSNFKFSEEARYNINAQNKEEEIDRSIEKMI